METLQDLREQLDEIDAKIVDLYQRRMKICEKVGELKIKAGRKVFDKQREKEKIKAVTSNVKEQSKKKGVTELFEQLMCMSRKLQHEMMAKEGGLETLPFKELEVLDAFQIKSYKREEIEPILYDFLLEQDYYIVREAHRGVGLDIIEVSREKIFLKEASKICICFTCDNKTGSLYRLLSHISYNGLNMLKIDSRPIKGKQGAQRFFLEFEGNLGDCAVINAIQALQEETTSFSILGNY